MEELLTLNETVKEAITIALIDLMNKKPLGEISISELTRVAGVSRASFYRNYESKEQILVESINRMYRDLFEQSGIPMLFNKQADLYAFCLPRFQHVRKNKWFFSALGKSNLISFAYMNMERPLLLKMVGLAEDAEPYFLAGMVGCCAGVIHRWVEDEFAMSDEDLTRTFLAQGYWGSQG